MEPNNVPQAPPPMAPRNGQYDFITDPSKPPSKLSFGNTKKEKLIVAGVSVVVLIVIATIFSSLFSGGGGAKQDYTSILQQQAEIIRISQIGIKQATQSSAQHLAVNTNLTLQSQQKDIAPIAQAAGIKKLNGKTLALGKDDKVDSTLSDASASNQFDSVFVGILQKKLVTYNEILKKVYDSASGKKTKATLSAAYDQVDLLIKSQSTAAEDSPATN
ncbi:MAG: hypothetical protein ABI354_01190 [Candidatus Saccharimonadales bacterium]